MKLLFDENLSSVLAVRLDDILPGSASVAGEIGRGVTDEALLVVHRAP